VPGVKSSMEKVMEQHLGVAEARPL